VARGPTVTKAAAGADLHLCIVKIANIKHAIRDFQDRGIHVIGLESSGHSSLWELDLTGPVACVLGSEGKGLKRTVLEACDTIVKIPLFGKVTSLNVSTAAAVFAFELRRQRGLR
jgi:23S rRNA (guanosine2251-2'-O)-methyltransferase